MPYLGYSATKDRATFHIPQLNLQIKVDFQLSVQFILRFESSEEVAWVREQIESSGEGVVYQNQ